MTGAFASFAAWIKKRRSGLFCAQLGLSALQANKGSRNLEYFILNPEAEWSNREVLNA
jgi:hypothetical protein